VSSQALPLPVQAALKELKHALYSTYGERLKGVYLYGSYARGAGRDGSDVDVLVVLDGPSRVGEEIRRMSPAVAEICLRHDLLVAVFPVSTESFQHRQSPFLINVRREAVAV